MDDTHRTFITAVASVLVVAIFASLVVLLFNRWTWSKVNAPPNPKMICESTSLDWDSSDADTSKDEIYLCQMKRS